jgi:hypothetical protein
VIVILREEIMLSGRNVLTEYGREDKPMRLLEAVEGWLIYTAQQRHLSLGFKNTTSRLGEKSNTPNTQCCTLRQVRDLHKDRMMAWFEATEWLWSRGRGMQPLT